MSAPAKPHRTKLYPPKAGLPKASPHAAVAKTSAPKPPSNNNDWLYGINSVEGQLRADVRAILELLIDAGARSPRLDELAALAKLQGLSAQKVSAEVLSKKAGSERHQGIAARYRLPELLSESDLLRLAEKAGADALFLVLDAVQDPHNLGACIRSAAAAGATAVIFPKDKSATLTAVAHRVSAGTAAFMPLVQVTNLARALETLKQAGVWCYGAAGEGAANLYDTNFRGATALVLGNEGDGLRRLTREICDGLVRIPMQANVESLNVSVAAGVMLFEVRRQRM
jgi:23S rRNA (guanosine2251-2'-O)-methyltransferase